LHSNGLGGSNKPRRLVEQTGDLGLGVHVTAVDSDPERANCIASRIPNRHDERAADTGFLSPWLNVQGLIGLDITLRNRFIALCGETGHTLADGNSGDNFDDLRRDAGMRFENETPAFDQMDGASVRPKSADDALEFRLHGRLHISLLAFRGNAKHDGADFVATVRFVEHGHPSADLHRLANNLAHARLPAVKAPELAEIRFYDEAFEIAEVIERDVAHFPNDQVLGMIVMVAIVTVPAWFGSGHVTVG